LRKLIWRVADFSGVEVLSYCVMSNHFHVLVAVPARDEAEAEVDERELLRRYRVLYANPSRYQQMRGEVLEALLAGGTTEGEAVRRRLVSRMHDVSDYMKSLKQRYTLWYNHTYGRVGTLWSERFKSVLVEGDVAALQIVSGYIDLNPVRAGMVSDPKDYRWSSLSNQSDKAVNLDGAVCREPGASWLPVDLTIRFQGGPEAVRNVPSAVR